MTFSVSAVAMQDLPFNFGYYLANNNQLNDDGVLNFIVVDY